MMSCSFSCPCYIWAASIPGNCKALRAKQPIATYHSDQLRLHFDCMLYMTCLHYSLRSLIISHHAVLSVLIISGALFCPFVTQTCRTLEGELPNFEDQNHQLRPIRHANSSRLHQRKNTVRRRAQRDSNNLEPNGRLRMIRAGKTTLRPLEAHGSRNRAHYSMNVANEVGRSPIGCHKERAVEVHCVGYCISIRIKPRLTELAHQQTTRLLFV
ncbi:hypothetical protein DEU56DRAFT_798364 [Suillus clintonianus]|uniref:uncharacterized protein n=1 Tax=Suillus clintonianus TaxID=1904413 RepID=UPI001B8828E4|nr:uncharacterized protein DEU56DRAFT_798364 [Suillus clintonianus]KAG2140061.1 hypothetical protein DEU56DRAFT_798364 [Suillus clintonianus]